MGKPKKGARDQEEDDFGEDLAVDNGIEEKEVQNSTQPTTKAEKKKKKKGKQKDDDWDDIESELQTMTLEANKGIEDTEDIAPVAPKKTKVKKKGVSAFALLAVEDEDGGGDDLSDKESDKEEDTQVKEEQPVNVPKTKKKGKKDKPKKQEDEDIDAILADIEKPGKADKKKKKKNKGGDAEEEDNDEAAETPVVEVEKIESKVVSIDDMDDEFEDDKKKKKKNKKKGKDEEQREEGVDGEEKGEEEDGLKIKSAAEKKKEKKEREKQKKMEEKQKQLKKEEAKKEKEAKQAASKPATTEADTKKEETGAKEAVTEGQAKQPEAGASHEATPEADGGEGGEEAEEKTSKKKKKKKADKEKEEKKEEKAKPVNKKLAALKEALRIQKEEEEEAKKEQERFRLAEEERIRLLEEEEKRKEELKLKKKQAKKEKEAQLKKEGKFLTEKQKQDKRKLEQMLEAMKLSGVEVGPRPSPETSSKRGIVYGKKKKPAGNKEKSPSTVTSPTEESPSVEAKESPHAVKEQVAETKPVEEVKDEWDAESSDEEDKSEEKEEQSSASAKPDSAEEDQEEEEDEDDEEEEDEESSEESESESESDTEGKTPIDRGREKVEKRAEKANKLRTLDKLRAPVVCVLGHVDTGKTKILDKLRRTNVQDGEAGGITQQIGATNVPKDAIVDKTKMVKEFAKQELKIPGLLIIDTPGHESFSNLRLRGSSLCDIAVLVIDIMHGLEPQTIESINLLKDRKTPFLVALNKIDRLYQWKPQPMGDVQNTLKKQSPHTKAEFDERAQQVIVQLAEEGLNAALFYENKNPKEYVSLVPTSAHSGDGMGNLVALVCELCQTLLAKRLMYSPDLQATVMEVKAITGMGTTVDVILINGSLNEGDTIVLAGTEGPIVTQIRGLLMPQPMKELRVKNQYEHHKTVMAAQGVKINAKEMEKALAGLPLFVSHGNDEKEYYKNEVSIVLKDTLEAIKVQDRGVFVQASTLGSLEALLEFLRTSKIPYAGINIGPVHKKDIMRASVMLEHDSQYAVILAFDVKVEREAQELADNLGVRIFTAEIIYHLFDAFMKYRDDLKKRKQEEFKNIAVFPCKLKILPQFIFNSRDPIVMGVTVEAGFLKEGTPICVPSQEFVEIGRVGSLELNHKQVDVARVGQEVCVKIVPTPGDAPKMFGRHFDETDMLVSKISRASIDAVKDYFREEMTKPDWKLMVELKRQFDIL